MKKMILTMVSAMMVLGATNVSARSHRSCRYTEPVRVYKEVRVVERVHPAPVHHAPVHHAPVHHEPRVVAVDTWRSAARPVAVREVVAVPAHRAPVVVESRTSSAVAGGIVAGAVVGGIIAAVASR